MSKKQNVSVVVTDLDNTLFDWVDIWYRSFNAMFQKVAEISKIPKEELKEEFKSVHQRHGTSEYAFSLEELPSLRKKHSPEEIREIYDPAIYEFRKARKEALQLYPGVIETLQKIKQRGALVVGYTESMAFYSMFRMKRLGLDGIIDVLYSPADHDLPDHISEQQARQLSSDQYQLLHTTHRYTPSGELKPNAIILLQILSDIGADPSEAIYIGDSLMKDISMAQAAGIIDVHAEYGVAHKREEYELLREVTHWTEADVEREKKLTNIHVTPTHSLKNGIEEILNIFEFKSFVAPIFPEEKDKIQYAVEAWKQTVDVQKHFNDIEMRIRNYAITIVAAFLGISGVTLHRDMRAEIFDLSIPVSIFFILISAICWFAFFAMDYWWYHRLLLGSVKHGLYIEKRLRKVLPECGLSDAIGRASPVKIIRKVYHSNDKMIRFYQFIGACLLLIVIILMFDIRSVPINADDASVEGQLMEGGS